MAAKNMDDIAELFKNLRFKKKLAGGVDEKHVWKQLEQLQKEYRSVYEIMQERYEARLQEKDGRIAVLEERLSQEAADEQAHK